MNTALILPAEYHDSVVLMRIAAEVKKLPGVLEAGLFMGSPANHAILAAAGLASEVTAPAGPDDLVISVSADDAAAADAGLARARELLNAKRSRKAGSGENRARTVAGAVKTSPEANLACFSIPGQYVPYEAAQALEHNLNLFIFSDNVPLEEEVALKRKALDKGLLCMGPDCGTAYVNGYGLGFCNALPRGRVGFVASSGTGLQAVSCALAACGEGVSQGIGVGGRDLLPAVGGRMTFAALQALDQDPETEVIALIAKEPHPDVAPELEKVLASLRKPTVVCCLGFSGTLAGKPVAENLDQAVSMILAHLGVSRPANTGPTAAEQADRLRPLIAGRNARVLGLYTGGTLAHEAHLILQQAGVETVFGGDASAPRAILDLGDDEYTRGRPHPMIDPEPRNEMIRRLHADGRPVILLFDLVLGRGSHPDPAGELSQALIAARSALEAAGGGLIALGSIVGVENDFQSYARQQKLLDQAGVVLAPSNGEAARIAALILEPRTAQAQ